MKEGVCEGYRRVDLSITGFTTDYALTLGSTVERFSTRIFDSIKRQ
jgi:hypothetical protein